MKSIQLLTATLTLSLAAVTAQGQGLLGKVRNAVVPKSEQQAPVPKQQPGTTPQQYIAQCPALPSVKTLVFSDLYVADESKEVADAYKFRLAFEDQINLLQQDIMKIGDAAAAGVEAAATRDADRIARQQTGRSVKQLENMTESQQRAMGDQMAAQQLSAAGLGNMSIADLQALEGKSDEEIIKIMSGAKPVQAEVKTQAGNNPELKRIIDRWAEIDRFNARDRDESEAQIKAIYAKHRERLFEMWNILKPFLDGKVDTKGEEAAVANYRSVESAFLTDCYTYWLGVVARMQERVKSKLADVPRYDQLIAQQLSASSVTAAAQGMPSEGYGVASQYLSVASAATGMPFLGIMRDAVQKDTGPLVESKNN